jgi:hypothetical protein
MCLLNSFVDLNKPSVVAKEMITRNHDSLRLSEMFLSLKFNYKKRFGENLIFRIIGMDLSWATIHAALNILNLETIEE